MKKYYLFIVISLFFSCDLPQDGVEESQKPVSSEKEITFFSLDTPSGEIVSSISGNDIHITVPSGTGVSQLVATFETTGERVEVNNQVQISGETIQNFSNILTYIVIAEDGSSTSYAVIVSIEDSSNADLESIQISTGDMSPNFDPDILTYTIVTEYQFDSITIGGIADDSNARVLFSKSMPLDLDVGSTSFFIRVVAEDETNTQDYNFTITRNPPSTDATLKGIDTSLGDLIPAFDPDVLSYSINAGSGTDSVIIDISGTANHSAATVDYSHDQPFPLDIGSNSEEILVTAEDGLTSKIYTLEIIREQISVNEDSSFLSANEILDNGMVSIGDLNINMILACNENSVMIPISKGTGYWNTENPFWVAETELTVEVVAEILQWALDTGKINDNGWDPETGFEHNSMRTSNTQVYYGNKVLFDLYHDVSGIRYSEFSISIPGTFIVDPQYANKPLTNVTWYGAIILCNWLTEMRDGNTYNLVYSGISENWDIIDTVADNSKTGFRLPLYEEWDYIARYAGSNPPETGYDIDNEYISHDHNTFTNGDLLTQGYCWIPSNYSSGGYGSDTLLSQEVAVFELNSETERSQVRTKRANWLGLYDVSGNSAEWVFSTHLEGRPYLRGGSWESPASELPSGGLILSPDSTYLSDDSGFRLFRTK